MSSPNSARRSSSRSATSSRGKISSQVANDDAPSNADEAASSSQPPRRTSLRSSSRPSVERPQEDVSDKNTLAKSKKKAEKSKKEKEGQDKEEREEEEEERDTVKTAKKSELSDKFNPWPNKPPHPLGEPQVPPMQDHWGWIITSSGEGGDAHDFSNQPAARASDGQTDPPLWENREFYWIKGNRVADINGVQVNQDDHLVLRLIDMSEEKGKKEKDQKKKGKKKKGKKVNGKGNEEEDKFVPRRVPRHCAYHGTPKDWNDSYAILRMNSSRIDYIKRVCCDKFWTNMEARFLAEQFQKNPDISIMELTCKLNDQFMGEQYIDNPQEWDNPSVGRTIECVRAEYLANKDKYDSGQAPDKAIERDEKEVVLSTGRTVRDMIDRSKEIVNVPNGSLGLPNYFGASLTIEKLKLHAKQRDPPVSMKKLGGKTKDSIIERMEAADKYGVDEKGFPNIPGSKKSGNIGVLSVGVVNTVFELGESPDEADYTKWIKRLQHSKTEATKNGQKQEALELQGLIGSLFVAQDAARALEAQASPSRKRPRSGSGSASAVPDLPSKRRKTSNAPRLKSSSKNRAASQRSIPRSRTSSKVKINEKANEIIEPSDDESDNAGPSKATTPRRKQAKSASRRASSSSKASGSSRRPSTRSPNPNSNDESGDIDELLAEAAESNDERGEQNSDGADDYDDGLDISDD